MKFVKVNDSTLRCLITEEEMDNLGFEIDELISDKDKAQDFLQIILEDAEAKTGFKMKGATALSVEATMLPGRGLSLTISGRNSVESVREKIRRFHDAMADYTQMLEEGMAQSLPQAGEDINIDLITLQFASLKQVVEYCTQINIPDAKSSLYKLSSDEYFLIIEKHFTNDEFRFLGGAALEYASALDRNDISKAFITEHGECIIKDNALEKLEFLEMGIDQIYA